jgi:hypothetical protein
MDNMENLQKNIELVLILITSLLLIDGIFCGYHGIKTGDTKRMPKILVFYFLKLIENGLKKYKGNNKMVLKYYSIKAYSYYFFFGGILFLIMFSVILINRYIIKF